MQGLVQERNSNSGNKMKTINYKNPYRKEPNLDNIVDQLCTRLQDIKDPDSATKVGMPTCALIEQTEAVRRYYAAFPALKTGEEPPLMYYLPPPAWCRKSEPETNIKMQNEISLSKDWIPRSRKLSAGKERRNSYQGQKKNNKKRCNSYSKSFESKENLPEWVTHEGVWDMETQDPVKEFIRAIALDEGYGTCENTVTDEIREISNGEFRAHDNMVPDWNDSLDFESDWITNEDLNPRPKNMVPDWNDSLDFESDWITNADLNPRAKTPMETEMYAKFKAKFDRSIEALWSKDQNTPDDEYQDLPIDFQDLLSSPSDQLFADPSAEKCSLISLTDSIWSNDGLPTAELRTESPSKIVDVLHDRFKPLNLTDAPEPVCPLRENREIEPLYLYEGDEIYDALSTVAKTMRSFTALNHSRERSGFVEVPPRRRKERAPVGGGASVRPQEEPRRSASPEKEDLLTSTRTHFRPIRREAGGGEAAPRYADGDSFDIRGDLDAVQFTRSASGGLYLDTSLERYLEFRESKGIDYGRLRLTEEQRCPEMEDPAFKLRFPLRQTNAAVQTGGEAEAGEQHACPECGRHAKKMRPNVWSSPRACDACAGGGGERPEAGAREPGDAGERKRRHSAARPACVPACEPHPACPPVCEATCPPVCQPACPPACHPACAHPHARFLHCCLALDRPLTR